jgi:transketolase
MLGNKIIMTTIDIHAAGIELQEKDSWHLGMLRTQAHSAIAARVLAELADHDPRICVLTADLGFSNRTVEFSYRHPARFFNLGIAEQNMVSVAAGLATTGLIPYVATFASFLGLLCCEHIRTDCAYPNLPVRLLGHHAGISLGYYGTSHHATEDIGIMRSIANLKIICPADAYSLEQALRQTVDVDGPIYFRLGRGREADAYTAGEPWEYGKVSVLRKGSDGVLFANGIMVTAARQAAATLAKEGVNLTVADLHTIQPFDTEGVLSLVEESGHNAQQGARLVFVAEEHNTRGGVATSIADTLVDNRMDGIKLVRIGFPSDEYSVIAAPYHLYQHYGLDAAGVAERVRKEVG